MAVYGKSKFFLLEKFQNFYTEIIRLKQQAKVGVLSMAAAAGSETAPGPLSSPDHSAAEVWSKVAEYLDREMLHVAREGTSAMSDAYRELVYVMAAVGDEVFVHLQWEGQQYWLEHLLEVRFFRSRIAGERIFRNIQSVLLRQDAAAEELAAVYLTALALGFRGQYWGGDSWELSKYRLDLLQYLARSNPKLVEDSKRLFPEAYRYTVQEGIAAQLPNPATWWFVAVGVVVAWLIFSTVAWRYLTHDIREMQKQNSYLTDSTQNKAVSERGPSPASKQSRETQSGETLSREIDLSPAPESSPAQLNAAGAGHAPPGPEHSQTRASSAHRDTTTR